MVRFEWQMLLIIRLMIIFNNFDRNYFAENKQKPEIQFNGGKKLYAMTVRVPVIAIKFHQII